MDSALLRSGLASPMAFAVTALLFMLMAALVATPPVAGEGGESLPTIIFGSEFIPTIEPPAPRRPPERRKVDMPDAPAVPSPSFDTELDRRPDFDAGPPGLTIPAPSGWRPGETGATDAGLLPVVRLAPRYPRRAALAGLEGEVLVEFTVTRTGQVVDPRVVEATPRGVFERAALAAIVRWRFEPRRIAGDPVESRARQRLEFTLTE
ncbi:MAG: energy transducer TonB [Pseudomonadota bacterium]